MFFIVDFLINIFYFLLFIYFFFSCTLFLNKLILFFPYFYCTFSFITSFLFLFFPLFYFVFNLIFNFILYFSIFTLGFPGGSEVKASACNAGGRSPGEGNGNSLQYSCLENPMDGGAWWATVHGVAKSRT